MTTGAGGRGSYSSRTIGSELSDFTLTVLAHRPTIATVLLPATAIAGPAIWTGNLVAGGVELGMVTVVTTPFTTSSSFESRSDPGGSASGLGIVAVTVMVPLNGPVDDCAFDGAV